MPFGPLTKVDGIDSPDDELSAQFSPDERVVYYDFIHGKGRAVVRRAERATRAGAFGPSTDVPLPNQGFGASFSSDERIAYFMGNPDPDHTQIAVATRDDAGVPFATAAWLWDADGGTNAAYPFLSANGDELFYAKLLYGDDWDLWRGTIADGGLVAESPVGPVNTRSAAETNPVLSPDGRTLFFLRPDSDAGTIWVAHRDTPADSFRAPSAVGELEGRPGLQFLVPTWASADGCRLYLSAKNSDTGFDIWVTERVR
jgi:hypothetical protein